MCFLTRACENPNFSPLESGLSFKTVKPASSPFAFQYSGLQWVLHVVQLDRMSWSPCALTADQMIFLGLVGFSVKLRVVMHVLDVRIKYIDMSILLQSGLATYNND